MNDKLSEAIQLLRQYNGWRKGDESAMPNPTRIAESLDLVTNYLERLLLADGCCLMPIESAPTASPSCCNADRC